MDEGIVLPVSSPTCDLFASHLTCAMVDGKNWEPDSKVITLKPPSFIHLVV